MATSASIIDALIGEDELSKRLGIHRTTLWRLRTRRRNPLPSIRLGGAIKYLPAEVEGWLARGGAAAGPRRRVASR